MNIDRYDTQAMYAHAKFWHEKMKTEYMEPIMYSVRNTKYYDHVVTPVTFTPVENPVKYTITVEDIDSVSAVFKHDYPTKRTALLNFASYYSPGGGFIYGCNAQEEMICHTSTLYQVISRHFSWYIHGNDETPMSENHMYTNDAMYNPDILFFNDDGYMVSADVITCAAPNLEEYFEQDSELPEDYEAIMEDRINRILQIAYDNQIDCLILGAFGCGCFKNNPYLVSKLFNKCIKNSRFANTVSEFIFAIPGDLNYMIFKEVLS